MDCTGRIILLFPHIRYTDQYRSYSSTESWTGSSPSNIMNVAYIPRNFFTDLPRKSTRQVDTSILMRGGGPFLNCKLLNLWNLTLTLCLTEAPALVRWTSQHWKSAADLIWSFMPDQTHLYIVVNVEGATLNTKQNVFAEVESLWQRIGENKEWDTKVVYRLCDNQNMCKPSHYF